MSEFGKITRIELNKTGIVVNYDGHHARSSVLVQRISADTIKVTAIGTGLTINLSPVNGHLYTEYSNLLRSNL